MWLEAVQGECTDEEITLPFPSTLSSHLLFDRVYAAKAYPGRDTISCSASADQGIDISSVG